MLAPLGDASQVWLVPVEAFKGGDHAQHMSQGSVLQPYSMLKCLPPQEFGEARVVKEGTDSLHQALVQRFRDSIVLQSVMRGELLLYPMLLVECLEGVAGVLMLQSGHVLDHMTQY